MPLHAIKLNKPQSEADARREAKEAELNGHGGKREGAGRKPKSLRYADELAQAENKIIAALPDVIDGLIVAAKAGDVAASRYLLDRVFGRVKEQSAAPADDMSFPYSDADVEAAERNAAFERMAAF